MKQIIVLFFLLFFCVIAQAADKVPMNTGQPIKPQIRAVAPSDIKILGSMIARGESKEAILGKWKAMLVGTNDRNLDINTLVQSVMRASYQQQKEDLNKLKDKVQYFNETKKKIRDEQDKTRKAKFTPGSAPIIKMNIATGKGTPIIISPQNGGIVKTEQERQVYLRYLQDKLNAVGDDAQLANIALQNALQQQQQILNMISNASKLLSDTAMNTVRKIGG
ncbi:MAG: hypothetical protein CVU55_09815 [Deltaproteobacteria bacterium HGW-Deltaproteobacteria-13]|jgi:hypothetical protein|nr:MAG: hypothetical protein CVU55_09815 [Deltaproteobacteria bacterium HGW-Deltaproteobacteria-13]